MKRRTEIFVEIEEVSVARRVRPPLLLWCEDCSAVTPMATPAEAALRTGRSARAVYRLVEAGLVHYVEHPLYELLVCLDAAEAGRSTPPTREGV